MQFKDLVSRKVAIFGLAILMLGIGLAAGITYQSAHGQQSADIMPQKSLASNNSHYTSQADVNGENGTTDQSTVVQKSTKKTSASTVDEACMVKAETNASGEKVFYLPNMRGYAKVPATTCFKSAELAAAAGYRSASTK